MTDEAIDGITAKAVERIMDDLAWTAPEDVAAQRYKIRKAVLAAISEARLLEERFVVVPLSKGGDQ